jgi:hypothetical protein
MCVPSTSSNFLQADPSRATSSGTASGSRWPIFSRLFRRYATFDGFGKVRSGMRSTTSTPEAEALFPKAYEPVLSHSLDVLSEEMEPKQTEALLRDLGRRIVE